jgi:DNA-binding GntR family transcriptional regulator
VAERSSNASQSAYDLIKDQIVRGDLAAGEKLGEADLAVVAGVSRTPIREALRRLAAEGFVTFTANRGAQVATYSGQEIDEIFQIRSRLDGLVARLAAERASAAQLSALHDLLEIMGAVRLGDDALDDAIAANRDFHRLVGDACGSARLADIRFSLINVPVVQQTVRTYTPEAWQRSISRHRELLAALEARDADLAEAIAVAHVLWVRAWMSDRVVREPA